MIVHDLDVFGIGTRPAKADTELIVHADAPLASTIAFQLLQAVRRWCAQVVDASCQVQLLQLAQRRAFDVGEARHATQTEQGLGVGTLERLDRHRYNSDAMRD